MMATVVGVLGLVALFLGADAVQPVETARSAGKVAFPAATLTGKPHKAARSNPVRHGHREAARSHAQGRRPEHGERG